MMPPTQLGTPIEPHPGRATLGQSNERSRSHADVSSTLLDLSSINSEEVAQRQQIIDAMSEEFFASSTSGSLQ